MLGDFHEKCKGEKIKNQKELKKIWHPRQNWEKKLEKDKKGKEKDWNQIKKDQRYNIARSEKKHLKESNFEDDNIFAATELFHDKHNIEQSVEADTHINNSEVKSTKKKLELTKVLTLNEYANYLKEYVNIICVDGRLCYFNGHCYQSLGTGDK